MAQLNPYLMFPGTCEEALNHYAQCLGGTIINMQRYGEAPADAAPVADAGKVLHAGFKAGDIMFMASDTGGSPVTPGNNVHLSINCTSEDEQTELFNGLADGGTVTMPLEDTFWGARFGMLTDRFGIHWMLNLDR